MKNRYAGILLPITALPTAYGVGSLGKEAKNFVDFLALEKYRNFIRTLEKLGFSVRK